MIRTIIVILLSLATVFGLQNMLPITLTFIIWRFELPGFMMLAVVLACGILIGILAMLPGLLRRGDEIVRNRKRIEQIESQLVNDSSGGASPHEARSQENH